MIRRLIRGRLRAAEKQLGVSVDYLRHMVDTSLPAFFRFARLLSASQYRKHLPVEPFHLARVVATQDADCGTCVQIEVNLALADKVDPELIRAALEGRFDDLPTPLADTCLFARRVVQATGDEGPLREKILEHYGDKAVVELAIAIAACRLFPIVKRSLGYAVSCQAVEIDYESHAKA